MHEPVVAVVQLAGIITTVGVGALIKKRVSTAGARRLRRAGQGAAQGPPSAQGSRVAEEGFVDKGSR